MKFPLSCGYLAWAVLLYCLSERCSVNSQLHPLWLRSSAACRYTREAPGEGSREDGPYFASGGGDGRGKRSASSRSHNSLMCLKILHQVHALHLHCDLYAACVLITQLHGLSKQHTRDARVSISSPWGADVAQQQSITHMNSSYPDMIAQ